MPIDEPKTEKYPSWSQERPFNKFIWYFSKQNNFYILEANIAINLRKFLYIFHIYYTYFPEPDIKHFDLTVYPTRYQKSFKKAKQDDQRKNAKFYKKDLLIWFVSKKTVAKNTVSPIASFTIKKKLIYLKNYAGFHELWS
ncbi:hypothetical protein BpHYR1_015193 [Brachionus plicatilis]|uniref:Uncharacterized protein n=1 Tax=Brachionus plicatilis TaxID=10195 RepID=A0A3M7QL01_BRAPC|nr:hypothetical protein BpHYR1_015193 [Brachionus plicatilis]